MTSVSTPPIVSKAEYARMRGVSDAYVSRLGKRGRLVLDADGRVIVAATDALIAQTRDPTRGGDRTGKHAAAAAGASAVPAGATTAASPPQRPATQSIASLSLQDVIRLEKIEKLREKRRENALEEGLLCRRDEVEAEAFARARQAQEALMAIPDRLAAQLAGESDPAAVYALLEAELRRVVTTIATFGVEAAGDDTGGAP
jgi:hypothetical protein